MTHEEMKKYAQVLLRKGLNIQEKQILVIHAPVEASAFVTELAGAAYDAGASQVVLNWRSDDLTRLRYIKEGLHTFQTLPDWRRDFSLYYYRQGAAFLSLVSANPRLLNGVDTNKIVAFQKASHEALKEYSDGMMASKVTWLVAAVPSLVWAKLLFPDDTEADAFHKLETAILKAARADGPHPLHDWDIHLENLKKRRTWLTAQAFTALHYTNRAGTDLTVGLPKGHIWQGGTEESAAGIPFNANIPTEEVYSAPQYDRVDGVVCSTRPLIYRGNLIDSFRLTFKKGKVISSHAEKGDDLLTALLDTDEGARRLGEVALIPCESPVSLSNTLYYETLLDENASCHLALGKAYPTCLAGGTAMTDAELKAAGLNDSIVHADFMIGSEDLTVTGIKEDGTKVPVFINGSWAD